MTRPPPVTSSHGPGSARQWPGLHWTSLRPALVPAWLSGSTAWLARNCGLTKNCFLFLSQKSAAALSFECRLYTFHKPIQETEFYNTKLKESAIKMIHGIHLIPFVIYDRNTNLLQHDLLKTE